MQSISFLKKNYYLQLFYCFFESKMLKYNQTVSMHLGSKLSRIVSIDRAFMPICFFSILFPRRFPKGSRLPFFNKYMFTQNVREKNISCPPMRANTENASTGGLLPHVDFIYILNRHGISCNPCHAVKARHCLVCHAAPRVMVPDSRGCGSEMNLGTKHPLIVRNCDG